MAEHLYNICIINTEGEVDGQADIVTTDSQLVLDIVDMLNERKLNVRYRAFPVKRYMIENEEGISKDKIQHAICYEL